MAAKLQSLSELQAEDEALVEATKELMVQGKPYDARAFRDACVRLEISSADVAAEIQLRKEWLADKAEFDRIMDPARPRDCIERSRSLEQKIKDMRERHVAELKPLQQELSQSTAELAQINRERQDASSRFAHIRLNKTHAEMRRDRLAREERMRTEGVRM